MTVRILVIDDDANFRSFVQDALAEDGHEVRSVGDGQTALDTCRDEAFEVVIVDMHMPGTTGNRIIAALKDQKYPAKYIAISGDPNAEDELQIAGEYLADCALRKPVEAARLCECVRMVLE